MSTAACLHLNLATSNFGVQELPRLPGESLPDLIEHQPVWADGYLFPPDRPGLGVTLDREALERLASQSLPPRQPWIVKTTYDSGARMYHRHDPADSIFLVRPDRRREFTPSWVAPISTEYWDDDGSPAFREMMGRLETEGMVLEG